MVQSCYLIWPCPGYVVTFVRSWSVSWVTSSLALAINACNISICWFGLSSFDMMRWKRKDIWKKPLVYSFQHSNRHLLKDIVSLYIWRLIFLVKKKKKNQFSEQNSIAVSPWMNIIYCRPIYLISWIWFSISFSITCDHSKHQHKKQGRKNNNLEIMASCRGKTSYYILLSWILILFYE